MNKIVARLDAGISAIGRGFRAVGLNRTLAFLFMLGCVFSVFAPQVQAAFVSVGTDGYVVFDWETPATTVLNNFVSIVTAVLPIWLAALVLQWGWSYVQGRRKK